MVQWSMDHAVRLMDDYIWLDRLFLGVAAQSGFLPENNIWVWSKLWGGDWRQALADSGLAAVFSKLFIAVIHSSWLME
jgi:hypothetical protein